MIEIEYTPMFLKDLKKIKKSNKKIYDNIFNFCLNQLPNCDDFDDIPNIKKIVNHENFYRIRLGQYRIGAEVESFLIEVKTDDDTTTEEIEKTKIYLLRILHRKDIYKFFPPQ